MQMGGRNKSNGISKACILEESKGPINKFLIPFFSIRTYAYNSIDMQQ